MCISAGVRSALSKRAFLPKIKNANNGRLQWSLFTRIPSNEPQNSIWHFACHIRQPLYLWKHWQNECSMPKLERGIRFPFDGCGEKCWRVERGRVWMSSTEHVCVCVLCVRRRKGRIRFGADANIFILNLHFSVTNPIDDSAFCHLHSQDRWNAFSGFAICKQFHVWSLCLAHQTTSNKCDASTWKVLKNGPKW